MVCGLNNGPRPSTRGLGQKGGSGASLAAPSQAGPERAIGRSRGGLTTKIHAVVSGSGAPRVLKPTKGQAHDGKSASDMLDVVKAGDALLADAAYDSDALRDDLAKRGAQAVIKPVPARKAPQPFSKYLYKGRNVVERFFNKLKTYRAIPTRYEKHDENFLALIMLVSIRILVQAL